jgi:hypothetical protein
VINGWIDRQILGERYWALTWGLAPSFYKFSKHQFSNLLWKQPFFLLDSSLVSWRKAWWMLVTYFLRTMTWAFVGCVYFTHLVLSDHTSHGVAIELWPVQFSCSRFISAHPPVWATFWRTCLLLPWWIASDKYPADKACDKHRDEKL